MEDLKGYCSLQLSGIQTVDDDPTLLKLTFSIIDFDVSGNRKVISKELAQEASGSLKLKPLLAQYHSTTDYENQNDCFGNHGEYITKDRYGNDVVATNTLAIGTSNEAGGYFGIIKDENGLDKEVLLTDFYLWVDKYPDIANLINDMWQAGIPLKSSCEYLYKNYEVLDGITHVKSPLLFVGHCVLRSGENNMGIIEPAYDSSQLVSFNEKWEKAVSQAIIVHNSHTENLDIKNNSEKEESENMNEEMLKTLCELSHGDIRSKLYTELAKMLTAEEFNSIWISSYDVFDTYFVYETYMGDKYVYFKVDYSKTETDVVVNIDSKVAVERDTVWVSKNSLDEVTATVDTLTTELNTIKTDLEVANTAITSLTTEKSEIETKFNEASETIISLNSKVEEMKPIVELHNTEVIEKAICEKKEYYTTKFKAVNAVDKFNSEEVQELIKVSINDSEEGKNAILSLNSMLVEMVQLKEEENPQVKETSSKNVNLIPVPKDFDTRYQA